jgi:hypothetical protein
MNSTIQFLTAPSTALEKLTAPQPVKILVFVLCGSRMDWIDMAQDRGQVAGSCECGNEPSVSIRRGEFLD